MKIKVTCSLEEISFTEEDIEKYLKYVNEHVIEIEEILSRCHQCGQDLNKIKLPIGPEKKVVCTSDREHFMVEFIGLVECGVLINTSMPVTMVKTNLMPKFDNLYIGEIILLKWLHNKNISKVPPAYFSNWYSLERKKSISKLEERKYVRIATKREGVESLKISQVKEILKYFNIKVSGNKNELVSRLRESITEELYGTFVEDSYYITNVGKNILDKYEVFIWSHKMMSTAGFEHSLTPINVAKFYSKNHTKERIGILVMREAIQRYMKNTNYYHVITNSIILTSIYVEEDNLSKALDSIIIALLFSLSCVNKSGNTYIFDSRLGMRSRIKQDIANIQSQLNISDDEIKQRAISVYNSHSQNLSKYTLCPDIKIIS